jgi:hypothetical protein
MQKLIDFLAFHGADIGFQFTNSNVENSLIFTIQNLPPHSSSIFFKDNLGGEAIFLIDDIANWKIVSESNSVGVSLDAKVAAKAPSAQVVEVGEKIVLPESKPYSLDLDLIEGLVNAKYTAKDPKWGWTVQIHQHNADAFGMGTTLPHALCIAYLKMERVR